jgi:argininosuccinate lyase
LTGENAPDTLNRIIPNLNETRINIKKTIHLSENTKIWSGRFSKQADKLMEEFSSSIHFDKKLFDADIRVNQEWALALVDAGIYTKEEAKLVRTTLDQIRYEYNNKQLEFKAVDEDIHTANERWLTEKLNELGAKIHTGRSRNDQVVTDFRIFLRENLHTIENAISDLQEVLLNLAENHIVTVFPGQTHLRQAQPVSFAHYLMAFFFQLSRDKKRLENVYQLTNKCPLGSGAIAGAAFNIDRFSLAKRLGFDGPTENSYDSTSDRDFVNDCHYVCSQIVLHLSRIAEDLIIWSSESYNLLEIDELYSTGSSMMPQKKNPDSLELVRGKASRIIGNYISGLVLMKGIPTAYVRDLQEDKEPLFDSLEQTIRMLRIFSGVFDTLKINETNMLDALDPALYATDVADYLVKKGVPFRKSHSLAGKLVHNAESNNTTLDRLSLSDYQNVSGLFENDVFELFDPIQSLEKRNLYGGTGPESVKTQIQQAKKMLEKE